MWRLPRTARIVMAVQALCFTIGAANHARDFVLRGWRPYRAAPLPAFEAYWSALLLLDMAAALLLATGRVRTGVVLGLAIMVSDVGVNIAATRLVGARDFALPLLLQAGFLGFLLGSASFLWHATSSIAARRSFTPTRG